MTSKPKPKVTVRLAATLRQLSQLMDEPEVCEVRADNPLECLQIMMRRHPSIRKWAYKDGALLPIMWFFVNDPQMRQKLTPDQFNSPLKDGDEVMLFFGKV